MKVIKIDKKEWTSGIEQVKNAYRVFGPIKEENKEFSAFKELGKGVTPDLSATDTRLSPKGIIFPQSEAMFEFTTDSTSDDCNLMNVPEKDYSPRAIVGIRPYDAAAFTLVKKNFDTPEYRDNYWVDAYDACTFIGLAVSSPSILDFSTSTKSGPFDETGLDVLLCDLDDHFLAKVISEKGETFLKAAGFTNIADEKDVQKIDILKKEAEDKIQSRVFFDKIQSYSILDIYEANFWEDISFACINCGTCTYVCPTCWCFDIQDEMQGKTGQRFKNWDSCMFPLFTLHTTGHNPRGTKLQRVRQRFMHKLKYFLDKYNDGIMCVGCGRCIRFCPVNIDIRRVCDTMNSFEPAK